MKNKFNIIFCIVLIAALSFKFISKTQADAQDNKKHSHDAKEEGHGHDEEEKGHKHGHDEEEKGHKHGHEEEEKGHKHGHDEEEKGNGHSGEEDEHGHGHGGGKAVGPGKAILEVDEDKGFKLSNEAQSLLAVKFKTVNSSQVTINNDALVTSQNSIGIYRYRDGFYKFITVIIKKDGKTEYLVEAKGLRSGDQVVTESVGLIRITDVYSTDTSEYGHSH